MNQETRAWLGMVEYARALLAAVILGPEGMDKSVGQLLRAARERAGITQQQLADHLGCTQPAVSQIESSDDNMALATAMRYLQALAYASGKPAT